METQQNKVRKFTSLIHHMKGKYKGVYLGGSHFVKNYIPILFLEKKGDKRNLCESPFQFHQANRLPFTNTERLFPLYSDNQHPPPKRRGEIER